MLIINTYIDNSRVHGKGVFAAEDIASGAVILREGLELLYTPESFDRLSNYEKEYVSTWGWKDKHDGLYPLAFDNDRFINHSDTPNTTFDSR